MAASQDRGRLEWLPRAAGLSQHLEIFSTTAELVGEELPVDSVDNLLDSPAGTRQLILVGGFLGAGKTTLIGQLVKHFQTLNLKCGVITNDQASGLVDTALAEKLDGAMVSEISGGCFCCKLGELGKVLGQQWKAGTEDAPDIIVAEPVGSCTDLMATVLLPLRRAYGGMVAVAPLSVLVDGRRALASLGGRRTPGDFSKDVGYIYRKQIEEAEIVVVNKKDLMAEADLEDLLRRLDHDYPGKKVFVLSARTGEGLDKWAEHILGAEAAPEKLMDVDYARYGTGEALLGWCNAEIEVDATNGDPAGLPGDTFLLEIAKAVAADLSAAGHEVAHFKMALRDHRGRLGTVNQVMSGTDPEVSRSFEGSFQKARLTVNLRAEGDPEQLRRIVEERIRQVEVADPACAIKEMAAFRPGQPVPVERVMAL